MIVYLLFWDVHDRYDMFYGRYVCDHGFAMLFRCCIPVILGMSYMLRLFYLLCDIGILWKVY